MDLQVIMTFMKIPVKTKVNLTAINLSNEKGHGTFRLYEIIVRTNAELKQKKNKKLKFFKDMF